MLKSLRSRILLLVISLLLLTVLSILYYVRVETKKAFSRLQDERARNLLQAVTLNVENEYKSLVFHKNRSLEMRKRELRDMVILAMIEIERTYSQYKSGELTEEEAKAKAIRRIRRMRYDEGVGYLWISNTEKPLPRLVMHPILPELEGKVLDDPKYFTAMGVKKQVFRAFADICLEKGGGYVDYLWPKPTGKGVTANQPKISYVRLSDKWDWVVGTGVYIDDIHEEEHRRLQAILAELREAFSKIKLADSGYLFIFDGDNNALIHPTLEGQNCSRIMNPVTKGCLFEELKIAAKTPWKAYKYKWEKLPDNKGEFKFWKMAYMTHFKPLDWYIGSSVYLDEMEQVSNTLEREILYISIVLIVIALFLSILLSQNLTYPLRRLMLSAREIGEKGLDSAGIPIIGTVETRELGHILDSMIKSIKETMKDKEKLFDDLQKAHDDLEVRVQERTAELALEKENAESANKAKSVFLANMSHELRTPMNAILGYSQIMQRDASMLPDQRKNLDTINRSGQHLLALINDVLEISKIEAGRVSLQETDFDLHTLLLDLKSMFIPRITEQNLEFEIKGIDNIPNYVVADKNKLRQILINLLGNAVKFTREGGIQIRCKILGSREDMRLVVEVEDTGEGISREEMDKVFQHFEQTESGRKAQSGTGLGMAISKDYAQIMGGDISLTSRVGKGSIFRLEIPIKPGDEQAGRIQHEKRVIGLEPNQGIPKILVVEDKDESRELLVTLMETVGFQVRWAVNGQEAVNMVQSWKPDFIWMDIRMGVMDGVEATRIIKSTDEGKSIVIVALTASALHEEREEILAIGCDDFVRKPFREQELFDMMAKYLNLKYVYEDEIKKSAQIKLGDQSIWKRLALLPGELKKDLHKAVVELDTERTMELINRLHERDAELGDFFMQWAEQFDYQKLLNILEGYEQWRGEDNGEQ